MKNAKQLLKRSFTPRSLGLVLLGFLTWTSGFTQNVGIGTNAPTRELSVNGSVIVDHDSTNYGTLYDPALLFGASGLRGISSSNNPLDQDYHALNFWTGGLKRLTLNQYGYLGIGTTSPSYPLQVIGTAHATSFFATSTINAIGYINTSDYLYSNKGVRTGGGSFSNSYKLQVNNGDSYFGGESTFAENVHMESSLFVESNANVDGYVLASGDMYANANMRVWQNMSIGGLLDDNYRLRVYDGNARIGGDFHATGFAAIGGSVDPTFRLRVYGGNSRFGGDVEVTGELTATNMDVSNTLDVENLTIKGNGSVRSNGTSDLKIHFAQKNLNMYVYAGQNNFASLTLPDFTGTSGDIRVIVSHFEPDPTNPGDYWTYMLFQPMEVDTNNDTCSIRIHNPTSQGTNIKGTLYMTVVMKD